MQIRTWKFITAGLVLVIIILCMMTFLLNGRYRNLQIQVNRMDREHDDLKKDYEKLYTAYYSYDKKILKLLETHPNVFWAKDSSAYVVKLDTNFLFSFYDKPKMNDYSYYLWSVGKNSNDNYRKMDRVDTLRPNQFILRKAFDLDYMYFVARQCNLSKECEDKPLDTVSTILLNK